MKKSFDIIVCATGATVISKTNENLLSNLAEEVVDSPFEIPRGGEIENDADKLEHWAQSLMLELHALYQGKRVAIWAGHSPCGEAIRKEGAKHNFFLLSHWGTQDAKIQWFEVIAPA